MLPKGEHILSFNSSHFEDLPYIVTYSAAQKLFFDDMGTNILWVCVHLLQIV